MNWIEALSKLSRDDKGFVMVSILSVEGSSPRDPRSKMIVDQDHVYDTIGGGNLEYQAIAKARELLTQSEVAVCSETFTLGKDLTQCCGGKVEVLFEYFPASNFNIALFGAGHVGTALATILSKLPCKVKWLDSREEQFSNEFDNVYNIEKIVMTNPYEAVENCPPGTWYLIMTHSHATDFEICEAILSRDDLAFCGLIGSKSKAAKFRQKLSRKQFTEQEISRLTSPIGLDEVPGKVPMEVAVSVSAQLISLHKKRTEDLRQSDNSTEDNIVELR